MRRELAANGPFSTHMTKLATNRTGRKCLIERVTHIAYLRTNSRRSLGERSRGSGTVSPRPGTPASFVDTIRCDVRKMLAGRLGHFEQGGRVHRASPPRRRRATSTLAETSDSR